MPGRVGLGVTHATLHTPLAHVSAQLNIQRITTVTQLTHDFMQQLLATNQQDQPPRLGVAALNPHAGEQGLFGLEEVETIGPAVAQSQAAGLKVTGPLPADTLFVRAADGEFDAVVAMYHDQGHIALKLLGMHKAVNITLGLPIIRTSVAHGTAFDLARLDPCKEAVEGGSSVEQLGRCWPRRATNLALLHELCHRQPPGELPHAAPKRFRRVRSRS